MIGYLKGEVAAVLEDKIILEVNSVGYNIFMPVNCLERIEGLGAQITVYTYLSVREDAILLYGFLRREELEFYKLLIQVNGVGPKAALSLLSALELNELKFAIASEDAKTISKTPGIGAKTAQRIIIDLKDKVNIMDSVSHLNETREVSPAMSSAVAEAIEALTALGYSASDSLRAVKTVADDSDDVEAIIKKALKNI